MWYVAGHVGEFNLNTVLTMNTSFRVMSIVGLRAGTWRDSVGFGTMCLILIYDLGVGAH